MSLISKIEQLPAEDYYTAGRRTCAGCGPALSYRMIGLAAGPNTVLLGPTGCMYVANGHQALTTPYAVPWYHTQLGGGGGAAMGTAAAFAALMRKGKRKKEEVNVIVMGGDGGTADIGFAGLSGAMKSGLDFLYILYSNESYANTGIQASTVTPWGAWTTFTPSGKIRRFGNIREPKDVPRIVATHEVPYVATATVGYPTLDLVNKVRKGLLVKGPAFLMVLCPCPKGWVFDPKDTVKMARLAVETGIWMLYEVEQGEFKMTYKPAVRRPVADYIKAQGRFRHLKDADIKTIQEKVDAAWSKMPG